MKKDFSKIEFLTVAEAAEYLRISRASLYKIIKAGTIKATSLGKRKTIIKRSDIDKLFE